MNEIHLANSLGRDAVVQATSVQPTKRVRWLDPQGKQSASIRLLKAPMDCDYPALLQRFGSNDALAQALVDSDPEIDFEKTGRLLRDTARVYVNGDGELAHHVHLVERVFHPDGTEREERTWKPTEANISGTIPLRWSGVFVKKQDAIRKFVFSGKIQLQHINGITYDFLYSMAKELSEKDCLMVLGAGPKSREPLILRRGGMPYRGFLEGRILEDRYCLTLHFSNLELKKPTSVPQ